MTTKEELEVQLEKKLADTRAECLKLIKDMPDEPSGYWKPEDNEKYWYVNANGYIFSVQWDNDDIDLFRLSQGNCFRTKEEAKHHKKKHDVIGKIRLAAMEDIAKNGELGWGGQYAYNYRLIYHHQSKRWMVTSTVYLEEPTTIYFKTAKAAKKCLADLGSELDVLRGEA